MVINETKRASKIAKQSLGKVTTGNYLGTSSFSTNLISSFGCNVCSWRDSSMCPHGLTYPQVHANRICSHRAMYLKEVFSIAGSNTRVLQIEEATRLKLLLDKLTADYANEGILDPNLSKLSKNIITLLDKMRKQDEGLKIQQEISVDVRDFRKVIDAQAKVIEDEGKQDITGTERKDEEEVPDIQSEA